VAEHTESNRQSAQAGAHRFSQLLDDVPALQYVLDAESGRVQYLSGEVEALLGRSPDECTGLLLLEAAVHPDDREVVAGAIHSAMPDDPPQTARYRVLHRDGSHRWVQDRRRLVAGETGHYVVGVLTDITAHRAADLAELAERERVAHSERAAALTQLAGGIAHQFNNILTAITGYTALAHESLVADDPARDLLDEALAAAGRAREVATSLLAFAGGVVLRPTEADINAIVGSAMARAWLPAERTGIEVVFSPEPLAVHADPARLEDAIAGLLVAIRGLEPGSPLTVRTYADESAAVVELVEPTGRLGDDPSMLVVPFRRPPERVAVDDLAFAAADGIARASGGRLEAEARAYGTVVRFSVPRSGAPALATDSRAVALAYAAAGGAFGASVVGVPPSRLPAARDADRVVLVVDDDEGVRMFMRALVARSGFVPLVAGSAAEALEVLAGPGRVDALVADVVMPDIGGLEMADLAASLRPGLPVLYVSGDPGRNLPVDFGGRPFLAKPFGPAAFRDALRALFAMAGPGGDGTAAPVPVATPAAPPRDGKRPSDGGPAPS
jgi:two-component system, cell cycle sensor histidine kinase and response regulator CckA